MSWEVVNYIAILSACVSVVCAMVAILVAEATTP